MFCMFSCFNGKNTEVQKNNLPNSIIKKTHNRTAVILDSTITLYNDKFQKINNLKKTFGKIVNIDSISKEKYKRVESKNRCDLHNYVHVFSNEFNGWIYGQFLFQETTERDTILTYNNHEISLIPCQNFGIGAYDEEMEELSFCSSGNQSPVLMNINGKKSIVKIENELYSEGYWTLDSNDGWIDSILETKIENDRLIVKTLREYQEGKREFELSINLSSKPKAIITEVSEIEYEY